MRSRLRINDSLPKWEQRSTTIIDTNKYENIMSYIHLYSAQ